MPEPVTGRGFLLTGVFLGIVVVGLILAGMVESPGGEPIESRTAPDFEVALIEEGTFRLSEHQATDGRPLVINLWASWCGPCREEIPEISAFAEAHPEIAVIGVAVEDQLEAAQRLAEEMSPSYPLAFGDDGFRNDYPSIGLPATYILDGEGTIVEVFNGILTLETLEELTAQLTSSSISSKAST